MIDTPQIVQTEVQATAVIHITVPRNKIQEVMGPGHRELMGALAGQGVAPIGPWFTYHLRMMSETFDFELGVPVDRPVTAVGRVTNSKLPATAAAQTIYHGSYEGLPKAWGEFQAWIAAQGLKEAPSLWETYLTDPSTNPDPATWQTELTRPLLK
jgi:effector-binding domain-containing protein